jgi:serine/threonine-protein kinase
MADSEDASARGALPIVPGDLVGGRYRVGEVIGEGGMGVVFEATHVGLETAVALKVIRSDLKNDEEFVLRFVNEARAAALLKGEHIARVFDVGKLATGEPYLVMERLEGMGLEAFLEAVGPLDPPEAVRLVLEVCEGLAEAHALSLVHRDIKPANLFLSRRPDGRSILKILDFGIAKRLADKRHRSLTNPARSLGSPWYMSPEQMMDSSHVDFRTDIWSVGVLLYELLTGEHPFDGESIPEVCAKVLSAPAPSVRELRRDIDPRLDAIITTCLEKDPAVRLPNVSALAESLLEFAPTPVSSASALRLPRSSRSRRSRRSTHGSLMPFSEELRDRRSSFSGALVSAGALAITGIVSWAAFAYGNGQPSFAVPWSKLEQLEHLALPGDPVLNPGPTALPLSSAALRLPTPPDAVPGSLASKTKPGTPEQALVPPAATSADSPLTPAEIETRGRRYENWLRQSGLRRVDDATIDANNPY